MMWYFSSDYRIGTFTTLIVSLEGQYKFLGDSRYSYFVGSLWKAVPYQLNMRIFTKVIHVLKGHTILRTPDLSVQ